MSTTAIGLVDQRRAFRPRVVGFHDRCCDLVLEWREQLFDYLHTEHELVRAGRMTFWPLTDEEHAPGRADSHGGERVPTGVFDAEVLPAGK